MITDYDLRSMMQGFDRDERDQILKKISETLGYMSETVNDFQTYFKPNNASEEAPVADIIERAVHFTQVRLNLYEIAVDVSCDDAARLNTYVNELVQVLVNLLNNAVDAIKERKPERKWIGIEVIDSDGEVCICVSDSGGGIPESIIDKVFEPYFSTKSKNGTGLGLYMAKMIVEKHGHGTVAVENIEGGARFVLRFSKAR
jgi:signal transduction histidine kinase